MTYRPNLPATVASTTQAGVIKADGTTLTIAPDATASVVGTTVVALTDISSGTLGGPAASDVDTLNRAGNDYKVTLSARAGFFRKTPAGSRTITLSSSATTATLTAADNDKQIVITGVSGSVTADGTISDGFSCLVINKTGTPLTYSGVTGLGGVTGLPNGNAARVYMAASSLEAMNVSASYSLPAATPATLGGVKPDGTSLSAAADGTLSVVTTTTHALPTGVAINGLDEIAIYSASSSSDVKYSVGQIATYTQSAIQSWANTTRPTPAAGQLIVGYNTTLSRFEFWNGSAWNQHVRLTDLSASSSQLFGGSGTSGVATPITVGTGLSLSGVTLSALPATVGVTTVSASGSSQSVTFPTTGSRAYDITLSASCTFTVSGGTVGELQVVTLIIRGGAGGFSVTLPTNVRWKNGSAPSVDTSAGSVYVLRIQTSDGGATYAGGF